jgi:uncharacterized protein YebE (UPF0316 family)
MLGPSIILSIGPVCLSDRRAGSISPGGGHLRLLIVVVAMVVRGETVVALALGAVSFGSIPEGIEMPMLLGALAFTGVRGAMNLSQSNYIRDKGYGMGHWMSRRMS